MGFCGKIEEVLHTYSKLTSVSHRHQHQGRCAYKANLFLCMSSDRVALESALRVCLVQRNLMHAIMRVVSPPETSNHAPRSASCRPRVFARSSCHALQLTR